MNERALYISDFEHVEKDFVELAGSFGDPGLSWVESLYRAVRDQVRFGHPQHRGDQVVLPVVCEPTGLPPLDALLTLQDAGEGWSRLSMTGRYVSPRLSLVDVDRPHRGLEEWVRRFLGQVREAIED